MPFTHSVSYNWHVSLFLFFSLANFKNPCGTSHPVKKIEKVKGADKAVMHGIANVQILVPHSHDTENEEPGKCILPKLVRLLLTQHTSFFALSLKKLVWLIYR